MLKENDLLMSLTGNIGILAILSKDLLSAGFNQRAECIKPNDSEMKECLYFYFRSSKLKQLAERNSIE